MTTLPLLLEPEQLATKLGKPELLILDLSSADNYARHHIPGALHVSPAALQSGIKPAVGKLPALAALEALFSQLGLSPDRHVIVYDDEGGGWAGRLIWTLDVLGHSRYSYLNGGLHAWLAAGLPTETQASAPRPSRFKASLNTGPIAEAEDILAELGSDDMAIWDARSPQEYEGSKVAAMRGGHIPGAVNIDWLELMDRSRHLRLRELDDIQRQLDDRGLSKDKLVITHCQTHHRSGLSYLVMKLLGYPRIKGYHGSWSEWGNREDTPVETGPGSTPGG